jgi:hypothetical protein
MMRRAMRRNTIFLVSMVLVLLVAPGCFTMRHGSVGYIELDSHSLLEHDRELLAHEVSAEDCTGLFGIPKIGRALGNFEIDNESSNALRDFEIIPSVPGLKMCVEVRGTPEMIGEKVR